MAVHTSIDYEVYDDVGNASVKVTSIDGMVQLKTFDDKDSKEWYGEFDISFNVEAAEAIAKAMLKVVEALKK